MPTATVIVGYQFTRIGTTKCSVWITAVVAGREKRDGPLSPFCTTFPGPSEYYNLPVVVNENNRGKVVVVVVAIERDTETDKEKTRREDETTRRKITGRKPKEEGKKPRNRRVWQTG